MQFHRQEIHFLPVVLNEVISKMKHIVNIMFDKLMWSNSVHGVLDPFC